MSADPVIPDRAVFKASEVCEIAQIKPFVLRSWEAEFTDLGAPRASGGGRVYRRTDVERVLRIKALLFGEGLTLSGVRRRFEGEAAQSPEAASGDGQLVEELLGRDVRERVVSIKAGLQSILQLLERQGAVGAAAVSRPAAGASTPPSPPDVASLDAYPASAASRRSTSTRRATRRRASA